MKYNIKLSKYMLEKCQEFAKKRLKDTELYKKRGGVKYVDLLAGAIGEAGVYTFLRNNEIYVNKPDFTIHTGKSYDADLTDGDLFFHVKSQTLESAATYGKSWLMQRNDPILHKPTINHYVIPTIVDVSTGTVSILGIIDIMNIMEEDLVGECKVDWFRKSKVALYYNDLQAGLTKSQLWAII